MTADRRTPTPSLRRRVLGVVLAVLALLLVLLGVTIDGVVGSQARRDLHDRLMATTARADALVAGGATPPQIVTELTGGGIRVRLVAADGESYGDPALSESSPGGATPPPPRAPGRPPPPGAPGPPPPPPGGPGRPGPPDATATSVTHRLADGSRLTLVADTTATTALLRQLRIVVIVSAVAVLLVAAAALSLVVHFAMTPLARLARVADSITSGDRGRRLQPDRPDTELGRAAAAFDNMLDALEDSEQRARTAAADAQRADEATRRFLVDAAHELRTPIAGMHAGAERIAATATQHAHDPEAEAQRHRAELVLTEARRAGRLVTDMLDLSRIDAGAGLQLDECDLAALVEAERDRSALLAATLTVTRTGAATAPIRADAGRIAQILANLADNARRHTPAGGHIVFDVRVDGATASVTVTDTGPGVPGGERERIFERLVRLDAARTRDHGGAGLGLPIARALARAHGGDLVCTSGRRDTQFVLTLPIDGPSRC